MQKLLFFALAMAVTLSCIALALGWGFFAVALVYIGGGTSVMLAALASAMIVDDDALPEDPMLVPGE